MLQNRDRTASKKPKVFIKSLSMYTPYPEMNKKIQYVKEKKETDLIFYK